MATIDRDLHDQHEENQKFADALSKQIESFGIVPMDGKSVGESKIRDRRRFRRRGDENVGFATLVDVDGILRWELGTGPAPSRLRRRRRTRRGAREFSFAEPVKQFKFQDLPPNEVGQKLKELDEWLTPKQGLFELKPGGAGVGKIATPQKKGRILLLVHGTFSQCDHLIQEFHSTPDGTKLFRQFLRRENYDQILAFNHPTLSVSPILNAATLAREFRASEAEVDIICHSRGGLVTRWWREFMDQRPDRKGRIVFAGSPLAGTGLAAPAQLKGALELLTNISRTLRTASKIGGFVCPAAMPIGEAAAILFGWFGKITALAARTPIIDAGVQLIPGLAGQSREGANNEILGIRETFTRLQPADRKRLLQNCFFLTSNFETESPGWKFWEYFRRDRLQDIAAGYVFAGDNDLVVDTSSMTDLADSFKIAEIPTGNVESFGDKSSIVHHLNYFQQPQTIKLIRTAFKVPGP